jgi:hypothetical protein
MHSFIALVVAIFTLVEGYIALYAFVLLLIFIHETGHLIAGRLCGLRLLKFRAGPIELTRTGIFQAQQPNRWKWHWSWKYLWSGLIVMQTTKTALVHARGRYVFYTLGGVLANFACALLALPIAIQHSSIGGISKYFVFGCIVFGMANLLPFRSRSLNFDSDGKQILTLLFSEDRVAKLYWFTVPGKMDEVALLYRAGQVDVACRRAEEFLRKSDGIEMNAEYRKRMEAFQSLFERIRSSRECNGEGEKTRLEVNQS